MNAVNADAVNADQALEQLMIKAARLAARSAAIRVVESSPDDTVRVEVDGDGVMTDLRLSESQGGEPPAKTAALVLQVYEQACVAAQKQVAGLRAALSQDPYLMAVARQTVSAGLRSAETTFTARPDLADDDGPADDDGLGVPTSWLV